MLFGIAAVLAGLACLVWATGSLLKALEVKVDKNVPELTIEERKLLESQTEANQKYIEACEKIANFGGYTGE